MRALEDGFRRCPLRHHAPAAKTWQMKAEGINVCDDLIFTSRVLGTAKALGLSMRSARDAAALVELARQAAPRCVLVDLNNPGLDLEALLGRLREACPAMPRVAGCDPVLPRSRFVEELPAALPGWLAG
jgi:hypothetical protein